MATDLSRAIRSNLMLPMTSALKATIKKPSGNLTLSESKAG